MLSSLANPFTGATVTGFTTPTYTWSTDSSVRPGQEQIAVTTLGGTQGSASAHSVSSPFTITVERPQNLRQVGVVHPVTGRLANVPRNVYKVRTRKGAIPLSGQPAAVAMVESSFHVPAGADTASADDILAMISAHIGALQSLSDELGETAQSGVL